MKIHEKIEPKLRVVVTNINSIFAKDDSECCILDYLSLEL